MIFCSFALVFCCAVALLLLWYFALLLLLLYCVLGGPPRSRRMRTGCMQLGMTYMAPVTAVYSRDSRICAANARRRLVLGMLKGQVNSRCK
jgi:hypothetical protein